MKIPDELLPQIYKVSKEVYEGKFTLSEGARSLRDNLNMNFGSAKIYIIDFGYLMNGKTFKRTVNAYSMEYLLKRIKDEYGVSQLKIALPALQRHIHYYEETHNITMNRLRGVYRKYIQQ